MRFREWLKMDEARFKGLQRAYYKQNPGVPNYILHQMYQNHVSPSLQRQLGRATDPVEDPLLSRQKVRQAQNRPLSNDPDTTGLYLGRPDPDATLGISSDPTEKTNLKNSPSTAMSQASMIDGVQWAPKPLVVNVNPQSFGTATLARFHMARFGFERLDDRVRNDTARTTTQQNLAAERGPGENEPIIMVREQGKFELLEGYHRTMSYLLSLLDPAKGAPPEQVQLIKAGKLEQLDFSQWQPDPSGRYSGAPVEDLMKLQQGDLSGIDYSKWKPVPIKAYIGRRAEGMYPSPLPTSPLSGLKFPTKWEPESTVITAPPKAA